MTGKKDKGSQLGRLYSLIPTLSQIVSFGLCMIFCFKYSQNTTSKRGKHKNYGNRSMSSTRMRNIKTC